MTSVDDFKNTKRTLKKKLMTLEEQLDKIDETTSFGKYNPLTWSFSRLLESHGENPGAEDGMRQPPNKHVEEMGILELRRQRTL